MRMIREVLYARGYAVILEAIKPTGLYTASAVCDKVVF